MSGWGLTIIALLLLLFGNRLPSMMRSLGHGITELKKGLQAGGFVHHPFRGGRNVPFCGQGRSADGLLRARVGETDYQGVSSVQNVSQPGEPVSVESARGRLRELVSNNDRLQEVLLSVKRQYRQSVWQQRLVRCLLSYFGAARFLRRVSISIFGWRFAGVLVGATVIGVIGFMPTLSWLGGLFGLVLGAGAFACLMYIPAHSTLVSKNRELQERMTELDSQGNESSTQLSRLTAELRASLGRQQYWSDYTKELEHRESQQYRLQRLAQRNWKAMRGGELEDFLEGVFSEL
jgi:hypothetical protein